MSRALQILKSFGEDQSDVKAVEVNDDSPRFTLGYWKIRGLAGIARLILEYGTNNNTKPGFRYENAMYEQGDAPEFSRKVWTDKKFTLGLNFPNLPYLIDNGVEPPLKLTESGAIFRYLARVLHVGSSNVQQQAVEEMLGDVTKDAMGKFSSICYNADFEKLKGEFFSVTLPETLRYFDRWLSGEAGFGDEEHRQAAPRKFLTGDHLCYSDFMLFDFLDACLKANSDFLGKFPHVAKFYNSVKQVPQIAKYMKENPAYKLPLNNKIAAFK